MEFAPIFWSWLATIIGSYAITGVTLVDYIKTLAKQGYKLNFNEQNHTPNLIKNNKKKNLLLLVPIVNLIFSFYMQRTLFKNIETYKDSGEIVPLNEKDRDIVENTPTLSNILKINLNRTKTMGKVGIITYTDENNQLNGIVFVDKEGTVIIEDVNGPNIESKNKLEQRAFLIELLKQDKLKNEYELLRLQVEDAIEMKAPELLLTGIEPEEIIVVANIIANYGNDIKIYIEFADTLTEEEEKENLKKLSETIKEISGLEIAFPEEENQKTLIK